MEHLLPVQIIDAETGESFEELHLDPMPHPGNHLLIDQQAYLVLEKRHSYQLRDGRYRLYAIRAYVRPAAAESERGYIGDPGCRYNAHSPLLRCAVNPQGPCDRCDHYQRR